MKSYIIILFSIFSLGIYAQSDEAKSKILLVKEKLENVPPYSLVAYNKNDLLKFRSKNG